MKNPLQELAELMTEYGVCIRSVPKTICFCVDLSHENDPYFCGTDIIRKEHIFNKKINRKFVLIEKKPKYAGMFLVERDDGDRRTINFSGVCRYTSLEAALEALQQVKEKERQELEREIPHPN